jgi:nitroreductase
MPITPVPAKTVTDALHWRYATKKFDASKKIPDATWAALEEALALSPSSFGLQPWKFIVVRDPATREKLSAASWGQRQPIDCSHFVVFAGRKNYSAADLDHFIARTAEVRGASKESLKGYADIISGSLDKARQGGYLDTWMSRQVYIALGQFMASAALLGVDVCPMEGIDPPRYDEILGLTAMGYSALCCGAAGYRAADDGYAAAPKVRFRADEVIVHV